MKQLTCIAAFVALIGGCVETYSTPPSTPAPIVNGATPAAADLQAKTVALIEKVYGDDHVYCSGVWVGPETILTANHCDPDDEPGSTLTYAGRADVDGEGFKATHAAQIIRRDAAHDLLMLGTPWVGPHAFAALSGDPYVGEAVQTMGHPRGLVWSYSTGVVAAVRPLDVGDPDVDPGMSWIQSTAPISPGNSGGGLFDAQGNLMGVCSRNVTSGQNLNFYVHVAYVRAFLGVKS